MEIPKPEQSHANRESLRESIDIWDVIDRAEKDEAGVFVITEKLLGDLKNSLTPFGVSAEAPDNLSVHSGIEKARRIVEEGEAVDFLHEAEFIDESGFQALIHGAKRAMLKFEDKFYVEPSLIKGAAGHDSWAGRGYKGSGDKSYTKSSGQHVIGRSLAAIEDYATRETQLEGLDYLALNLILTEIGPVFFSSNAHRTSAAKLRGEPLGFSSIKIYDKR